MKNRHEMEALFWCELLSPLIFDRVERGEKTKFLADLASRDHVMPDGQVKKTSLATLKRKLKKYREKGFSGLLRKVREDKGKIKAVGKEILETAIELKKDQPYRGEPVINDMLEDIHGVKIKRSTLHRHLHKAGATKRKLGLTKKKVRKRWSRNHTHSLWSGDFSYGPSVLVNGQFEKTYLSAFVDCHSRYAVAARYYFRQSFDILVDTLLRAWNIHGASLQLHVDNGKVYHANQLKKVCFELGIDLIHRPVRDPAAGGLIERFILSAQNSFEQEVRASEPMTLEKLNKAFSAWLEVGYNQRIHSETGQTPKQRYDEGLRIIRRVDLAKVLPFFMKREQRTVDSNYADVRVNNKFYRVDPRLRGDRVQVLLNLFDEQDNALIYSLEEQFLGKGILYHREYGETVEEYKPTKAKFDYLGLLIKKHDQQLDQAIDYCKLGQQKKWPFTSFTQTLARYLGRKGGVSAFSTRECEQLSSAWQDPKFDESLVVKTWQEIYPKTFACFIAYLNKNLSERNNDV